MPRSSVIHVEAVRSPTLTEFCDQEALPTIAGETPGGLE
jgi:hypothetical protein